MPVESQLLFANEEADSATRAAKEISISDEPPWKIMVIDDDNDIHDLTSMVLRKLTFANRPVNLIDGYSGVDARRLIQEHPDTAIVLLDVVMETDIEGLEVVQFIRNEMNNKLVRIIIRTGQPGHAPEAGVVDQYDIDDYLDKINIRDQTLHTVITTNLRAFNLLHTIQNNK
jgi:adenylate cyclase